MPAVGGRNEKAAEIFVRAYFYHGSAAFAAGGMAGRVFLEARGLFGEMCIRDSWRTSQVEQVDIEVLL